MSCIGTEEELGRLLYNNLGKIRKTPFVVATMRADVVPLECFRGHSATGMWEG